MGAHLRLGIAVAQLNAASGNTADAIKDLESLLSEAQKAGFYGLQLDARLALGEIEVQSGEVAVGRMRLEALEGEASTRGYGLIARKAKAARSANT